jgi:NAD(P)-dependent dehydrogenase (short-subunit alcohol dehydrogenase family)
MAATVIERGAHVVLLGRRRPAEVASEVRAVGEARCVSYVQAPAEEPEAVEAVFAGMTDLRAAIANAGVTRPQAALAVTREAWEETMRVNVDGTWRFARAAASRMVANGGGSLVLVSSWAQEVPDVGNLAYSASKAAVRMMGRSLALELGPGGVRVNQLVVGIVDAGMARRHMELDRAYAARAVRSVPLGRLATAEDVARGAAWLCSDESAYVTGTDLVIDGGAMLFRRGEEER